MYMYLYQYIHVYMCTCMYMYQYVHVYTYDSVYSIGIVRVIATLKDEYIYFFCCIGNAEDKNVPTLVQGLAGHKVVGVELGSGDAHTLALEDNGT